MWAEVVMESMLPIFGGTFFLAYGLLKKSIWQWFSISMGIIFIIGGWAMYFSILYCAEGQPRTKLPPPSEYTIIAANKAKNIYVLQESNFKPCVYDLNSDKTLLEFPETKIEDAKANKCIIKKGPAGTTRAWFYLPQNQSP